MASSNSDWRADGRDSNNSRGQYNNRRGNKNFNRGRNNQWKNRPQGQEYQGQGYSGEGDGPGNDFPSLQSQFGSGRQQGSAGQNQGPYNNQTQAEAANRSNSSSSSSSSGSSPSTVVSTSPKSDNFDPENPQSPTNLENGSPTQETLTTDGQTVPADTNGNNAPAPGLEMDQAQGSASPLFESASENEDEDFDVVKQKSPVTATTVNGSPQAKPASQSFVEILDSEEEEDGSGKASDEGTSVTHASLVVNLDSKNPVIDFKSFTTPPSSSPSHNESGSPLSSSHNESASPLSSSRSAPPDLSVEHVDESELTDPGTNSSEITSEESSLSPTSSSKKDLLEVDSEGSPTKTDDESSSSGTLKDKEQPYVAKKKNSVSFAPETIDIEQVIHTRPLVATSPAGGRSAVSPSILVNGGSGGLVNLEFQPDHSQWDSSDEENNHESSTLQDTVSQLAKELAMDSSRNPDLLGSGGTQNGGGAEVDDLAADEEVQEINAVTELPVTTTELTAPNGVKVYVVGTAHFSLKSQQDVIDTIQKVQPNVVVVELCQSRRNILTLDEETILREASDLNFEKVRLAIRSSGAVQGLLHLLLLSMSAQITKKLGMAPGGEFRVSLIEARKIPNCMIYLGDRPFNITLSRALAALTLKQKVKLCWQFLTNNEDITKEEIERCKEKDLLEKMLFEMMGEYPSISQVFVQERDIYLAHSLWGAAHQAHCAVCHAREHGFAPNNNSPGVVVGVVGMGHVAGIVKNWGKTTEEQISEITFVPEPSMKSIIIRKTIKISFYALLGYGTYKFSRRFFNFPSDVLISRATERLQKFKM